MTTGGKNLPTQGSAEVRTSRVVVLASITSALTNVARLVRDLVS